jgi:hypothetical protein
VRITKNERLNSARFGCAFLPKQKLICVPWQHDPQTARSANILVRLNFTELPSAPLLVLAFEISRSKVLPHYCYLPFDLRDKAHAKYLSSTFRTGKIDLCFLINSRQVVRTHEISPRLRADMATLYATAMTRSKAFRKESYDFDRAVAEFEHKIRLVDLFQYVVTDSELRQAIEGFKNDVAKVAPDDKTQAAKIATELLGVFSPQHDGLVRDFIKEIPSIRQTCFGCQTFTGTSRVTSTDSDNL